MTSLVGGQAEDYLRHLVVERGLSDNTVQAYRRDLLRYQEYLGSRGIGSLAEVTRVDVEEFRRHLDHIGLAPASVTRCVVAVRNLHRFAVGSGQLQADVTAGMSPGTRSLGSRKPCRWIKLSPCSLHQTPVRSRGYGTLPCWSCSTVRGREFRRSVLLTLTTSVPCWMTLTSV